MLDKGRKLTSGTFEFLSVSPPQTMLIVSRRKLSGQYFVKSFFS
jgi:hypothetical protein